MDRNHALSRDAVGPPSLPEGRRVDFPLGKYCTVDLGGGPGGWLHSNTTSTNPTRTHPILLLFQGRTFWPSIPALLQDHPRSQELLP